MPHNPIIKQTKMGTSPPVIGRTQRGVLYDGREYRDLPQKMGLRERVMWQNHTLTIVDCGWHVWRWTASLTTSDNKRTVDWDCEMSYRVADATTYVKKQVSDLENRLKRTLLPSLATVAGRYRLLEYQTATEVLRREIKEHSVWDEFGLEVDPEVKIVPGLSDADRQFIDEAQQLQRATTTPRSYIQRGVLPSAESTYTFDVTVHLHIKIIEREAFNSLAELERMVDALWSGKVRRALARISRKYTYQELATADEALDQALEDGDFDAYGLSVVNASAELSLGTTAAEAAREDKKVDRDIEVDVKRQEHFRKMAFQDRAGAVAMAVTRGEMSVREALSYFDERDLQRFRFPMETLEKLRNLDVLGPDEQEVAVRMILGQSLSDSSGKSMPNDPNQVNLHEMIRLLEGSKPTPTLLDSASDREEET